MRRFSVFLTPAAPDFAYTQKLIEEYCAKFDQPSFEPHVTVYTGDLTDPERLKMAVSHAAAEVSPYSLRVRGIGCSDEYFRTLFIELEENRLLREIFENIHSGFGGRGDYRLFPHLSLLYMDMPLRDKKALARRVKLDREEILFDRLKLVTPGNDGEGWRDPAKWETLFSVGLKGYRLKMPIRAVLFDFGGVLAEEGFRDGLYAIARGLGLDPVEVHRLAMDAMYECGYVTGRGCEGDFWELLRAKSGIKGEIDLLSGEILRRFVLRPRMMELVRSLRQKGYLTAILSDQTDWLARLDENNPFFRDFDRVLNSYDMGKGKRDRSLFRDAVAALGLEPGEVLFVDDMLPNVERARKSGLQAMVFSDEDQLFEELKVL